MTKSWSIIERTWSKGSPNSLGSKKVNLSRRGDGNLNVILSLLRCRDKFYEGFER